MSSGGFFFNASSSRLSASSRDRSSGGAASSARPPGARTGPGPRAVRRTSSASGSRRRLLRIGGLEPRVAQFGFDQAALGLVQLPVVDADLRDVAAGTAGCRRSPARRSAGPRCRVGRERRRSLSGTGRRPVAMQRRAARPPGDADDLETRRLGRVSTRSPDWPLFRRIACRRPPGSSISPSPCLPASESSQPTQALAGAGRVGGPEDDEQAAGRRHPARELPAGTGRRTGAPAWRGRRSSRWS